MKTFEYTDHSTDHLTRKRGDYGNGWGFSVIQEIGTNTWDFVVTQVADGEAVDILEYTAVDGIPEWKKVEELIRLGYFFTDMISAGLIS